MHEHIYNYLLWQDDNFEISEIKSMISKRVRPLHQIQPSIAVYVAVSKLTAIEFSSAVIEYSVEISSPWSL